MVIAIIAILAAVVTVAAGGVINSAKRAKAGVACNQIVTAITSYYTDYGVYPVESGNVGDEYYATQDDWDKLTIALCGNINPYTSQTNQPSTVPNARATIYLTVQHSDVDNTGALKTPFTAGNAPEYYYAEVDSDYSNTIGGDGHIPDFSNVTSSSTSLSFDATLTTGAAAWSNCDAPYGTTTTPSHWVHTY